MPELPDVVTYLECLAPRVLDQVLESLEIPDIFVLRSVEPPPSQCQGRRVRRLRRLGKRVVLELEGGLFLVIHLMIAGRLRWRDKPGQKVANSLARLTFPTGCLHLTEAGTKRRAKLFVEAGEEALRSHDRGGLEVLECDLASFAQVLQTRNHTLKRALTDPHLFSGIGNAYSDEILHRARLSPVKLTQKLSPEEVSRLYSATRQTLLHWIEALVAEAGSRFPEKVTAFRPGMAVHGRYHEPCPDCGTSVQRIRYADNETNYCPECQTEGRLLADRALSRLLRSDWPRSLDQLEDHLAQRRS